MANIALTTSRTVQIHPLTPRCDLTSPCQLKVCFPILLDGDLVTSPEHLGPAYLTAVLRNAGAMVRIIEVPLFEGENSTALNEIAKWKPDMVGISLTTISVAHAQQFGTQLRQLLGAKPFIFAGGALATHSGANLLKLEGWHFLDGLIRSEGEIAVLRLAETLHSQGELKTVPNLVYRDSCGIVQNPLARAVENLDDLPDPARDQLEQHNENLSVIRLSSSRGCTAQCTFCNAPHAGNRIGPSAKGWRGASPKRVVDQIERLIRKYDFHTFDFVDSTFEDPDGGRIGKARVRSIAEEILERDLKIYYNVCMQAYNWHEEDKPLLELLWRSGLEKVNVGIESGSETGLKRWGKKSTVEDNRRFIRLLTDANVCVTFGFIAFHPWSTFQEVKENCQFIREIKGHNLRRMLERLELYPGAEVIEQIRAEGLLLPEYDTHLNPFAYRYVDPRIGLLASALNTIYGEEYQKDCLIKVEPAVFEFETYDVVLHNYVSRLLRIFGEHSIVVEIVHEFKEQVNQIKKEIADFNFEFVSTMISLAEAERLTYEMAKGWAEPIERFFSEKVERLRSLQLQCGLRLYRSGYPVRAISSKAPLKVLINELKIAHPN